MRGTNAFKALALCITICAVMSVIAACTIHLRGEENQPLSSASTVLESDAATAELQRCRTVGYKQKERLAECRRIWADNRRQFLGHEKVPPSISQRQDPGDLLPPRGKDESRLPSGFLPAPTESER